MTRRITYRGRDHYVSNGRPAGFGIPLEVGRGIGWSTRLSIALAIGTILYFALEFLR